MRKSTVVLVAILLFGAIATTWVFKMYTDQVVEEIRHAKDLTDEFGGQLAPGTKIRLRRVAGERGYVVTDPQRYGLLVEASPSQESWKRDPTGFLLARDVAARAFEGYGPDRPVDWVEAKLRRVDGTLLPSIGLEHGEGTTVVPIDPTRSAGTPR